jgi:REP element-mobilizing transposase RayT
MQHRHSIRLPDYDYTQDGVYFVTICAYNRDCIFGHILDGEMRLNGWGGIVQEEWLRTAVLRPYVILDEFVVMPNHFHGIVIISRHNDETAGSSVGARRALPLRNPEPPVQMPAPGKPIARSLGIIVGSFKSAVTKRINEERGTPGAIVWQRNYYEHIIQDEESLNATRLYIQTNPAQWDADIENPANASVKEVQ